jgi:hypothetical protein
VTLVEPGPSLIDRVYARTFAITARGNETAGATKELLVLANGNPHVLGRVRDRFELLRIEQPVSDHVARALRLVTEAWVEAIQRG